MRVTCECRNQSTPGCHETAFEPSEQEGGSQRATFHISEQQIEEIRRAADAGEIVERTFATDVMAEDGTTVAEVDKLLYVRRKPLDPDPA